MSASNGVWTGQGRRIFLQEVGTRDGLQAEAAFVPTEDKVALVNALSDAGLAKIEVTAFVSPKAIPALRDAEQVLREIRRKPGVVYSALVPNVRGAERAIDSRADEMNLVMSATESHNLANLRMTREQSFAALVEVAAIARSAGIAVNVSLSCTFGCPMEGDVPMQTVLGWCGRYIETLGAHGVTLCDTTGMAFPTQVAELTRAFRQRWPATELTLHFHNTRGMGLANVLQASTPAPSVSTPPLAASVAVPTRQVRAVTSAPKRSRTRSRSWATTPASTCHCCWRPRDACRHSSATTSPARS